MKKLSIISIFFVIMFSSVVTTHVMAAEKVMEQDTVTTTTEQTNIVKTADNFIILLDSSSSMNEPYLNTGMSKLAAAKEIFKEKNKPTEGGNNENYFSKRSNP